MKSNLRIIAESNPKTLLKKREFWFSQKEFILTIVPAILIGPFLVSFTYEKADLLTYVLNIIIHSFALLGVVDTAKVLAEIQVECAIVRFVEKMGTDYLKKVNNDRNAFNAVIIR